MDRTSPNVSFRLAVIDSAPQDYGNLLEAAGTPGLSLHFLASGNDTLKFARRWQAGLWVVNTRLCDMNGFDLAATLRSTRPSALIFLVGNEYNPVDELQTLTMGFAKYICKPLEPSWVLPQEGQSCIPLPRLRIAARPPRASAKPIHRAPNTLCFPAAEGLPGPSGSGVVILPFAGDSRQRPAA
jgi:CheY-like chemotaxis protein